MKSKTIKLINKEVKRAREIHDWPKDIIHQAAIISEESGEVIQAALNHVYSGASMAKIEQEVIHTAATCIRFLEGK